MATDRSESMNTIDEALASGTTVEVAAPEESPFDPEIAPGVKGEAILTGEKQQKEAAAEAEKQQRIAERSNSERQRMIEEAIEKRNEEEAAFAQSGRETAAALKSIVRNTSVRLASIPTPGSILFPLGLLLVFFFLLIPVNGHTRLTWLWLVITGNASISEFAPSTSDTISGGGATGTPAPGAPQTTVILQPPISSGNGNQPGPVPLLSLGTFTGVEGS